MIDATREKTRLWLLILIGVVATLLGQTHAREIFAPSPPESGVFAAQTQASTGENYDGIQYDALDSLLAAKTPLTRLQGSFDDLAEQHLLPQFRSLDPNLKAGYTGSFRTGTVGNPNKPTFGQPIDFNKFDVDYWIESDVLFQKFGPNLKANPAFRKILSETPGFEGLKANKEGFSIKFKPAGG